LNNELEMLTYTISHDLKNPLSVLKMGLKYLEDSSHKMPAELRIKWYKNLSQRVRLFEDIVNNTIQVSTYKTKQIVKEHFPMNFLVHKISDVSLVVYQDQNCMVSYGTLMPIWG